jgi:hypothetical protein
MTAAPPTRKRPFGAFIRTLNGITNSTAFDVEGNDADDVGNNSKFTVQHIPSLTDDRIAAAILRRIHSEFGTIIEKRGWLVTSISEMCCCGDGLDCLRKRKIKVMPDNVLGYNRISTSQRGKSHDIHLRLRHPRTHALLDYESIAGTMCHELAHCVRGSHDAKFYEAMNEIEEQYVGYLAKGVVLGKDRFPLGGGGIPLGGGGLPLGSVEGARDKERHEASLKSKIIEASESRRKKGQNGLTQRYVLGGDKRMGPPREAARMAAERRLLDSQYCLPCNEIIELLGEDDYDDDDDDVEVVEGSTTKAGIKTDGGTDTDDNLLDVKMPANDDEVIDLTLDDSFTATLKPPSKRKIQTKQMAHPDMAQSSVSTRPAVPRDPETWTCRRCTLFNPPTVLVCIACHSEQPCDKTVVEQAKELHEQDDIDYIKGREVRQSRETFGGFNIYGEKKDSSSTMKHLT